MASQNAKRLLDEDPIVLDHCSAKQRINEAFFGHSRFAFLDESKDDALNATRKRKHLLVVDDDDVDRERIHRYVKKFKLPLAIIDASSGSAALEQILQNDIDIILIDYQLGDMTGVDVLNKLRDSKNADIPTIMITGRGDESAASEALKLGVVDYLPKRNLSAETLYSSIEAVLDASRLRQEIIEHQRKLKHMSLYDALTDLPNRNLFFDRLEQAIEMANRDKTCFSVVMIDLNLFKEINDSMGHPAGDRALQCIAEHLQSVMRKSDTVARLGGDEFVCILRDTRNLANATHCTEKILDAISQPFLVNNRLVQIGASLGIAKYPEHGKDASSLLSNADKAMYKAKKSSRNYVVYNEIDDGQHTDSVPLSQLLFDALKATDEVYLEYQPKINLDDNRVIGVEALARWNSPTLGIVPPDTFIQAAERSTLIQDVTSYITCMALKQLQKWKAAGLNIPVSLNISARNLDDELFPDWMNAQCAKHRISPSEISLEITETTLSSSGATARKVLRALSNSGYRISVDDFGKGYTSFQFIRDIDIDEIKIDRMFINNIIDGERDSAIVRSLILLANSLGLTPVAEGVETREQWETLKSLGCPCAQGYHISKPMKPERLIDWIKQRKAG
ncbi:MAG: EAL domain-containing protein [Gammaproteobacteria bacterium]|nr:EAL domain-containing protein [Gammaproteobacteria bacterium]